MWHQKCIGWVHGRAHWCPKHLSVLSCCSPQLWNTMWVWWSTLNLLLHSSACVTDTWKLWMCSQGQDLAWNKETGEEKTAPEGEKSSFGFYFIGFTTDIHKNTYVPCIMSYQTLHSSWMVLQLVRLVSDSIELAQRTRQWHLTRLQWGGAGYVTPFTNGQSKAL